MPTVRTLAEFNELPDRLKTQFTETLKNRFQRYAFSYTLYEITGELAMWGTVIHIYSFEPDQQYLSLSQYDSVRMAIAADYSVTRNAAKPYTAVNLVNVTRLDVSLAEIFNFPGFYFDYTL